MQAMVAMMDVCEISVGSVEFKETERRLQEWGRAARNNAQALGMPTQSPIARMIEQVKVHEQLRRGVKPLKRSKLVKADKEADAIAVSLEIRHSETQQQHGKESFSVRLSKTQWEASVIQVEEAVKKLDKDWQKAVFRSYRYGQPDRDAARELRMPKDEYRRWREAAVIRVAEILADRGAFRHIA